MSELLEILFADNTWVAYLAAQIFGLLGFLAMSIMNYLYRTETELPFSLKKWWKENWGRALAFIILLFIGMFIGLRFQTDIVDGIQSSNTAYSFRFVKDKWFWFVIGGFFFRAIIHQGIKLYRKLTAKEVV
jgi:hypothetical protein